MTAIFDLAVIGAGPGGDNAAEYASANGLKTIIFEKNNVGGVCLNEGCVPTKTILHSAHIYHKAGADGRKYAVSAENIEVALDKLIARKNKIIKKFSAGIRGDFKNHGVELVMAEAVLNGKDTDGNYRIDAGGETYLAKHILLATGSRSFIPPIPGLDKVDYWTNKEALDCKELPKSLTVIGGGVIGMEFVSFFNTMGVPVTVVEMMPKILGPMDEELSEELMKTYEKRGVKFYLNTKVVEVAPGVVYAELPEGERIEIPGDRIMVSVGRKAVTEGLGLDSLGIKTERGAVPVNEHMQTSDSNVYACGDITGQALLAHVARREGQVAVHHLLGVEDAMSYKAIPAIVYTDPEVSSVGATERELKLNNIPYEVLRLPMSYSGRFVIENEQVNGICKVLTDAEEKIIGAHLLGNTSSEFITIITLAVEKGMTVDELSRIVFPHPTISEILFSTTYPRKRR